MTLNAILPWSSEAAPIFAAEHLRRKQVGMFLSLVAFERSDLFADRYAAANIALVGYVLAHVPSGLWSVLRRTNTSIAMLVLTSDMNR